MQKVGNKKFIKFTVIAVLVALIAVLSAVCLTGCGEIRYDHYVLTTQENADGTLTVTACTVVKDKDVVIPAEYKGKKISTLGDGKKAVFGGCEFSTLRVEAGVKVINDNACKDWSPLKTLELNEGLERIGANAFFGCTELKDITVPKSVVGIGENAFEDTAWYKDQPNGKIIYVGSFLYEYKGNMPANTVVDNIDPETKYVSDYAFSGCIGLKGIVLPEGMQKIGAYAFAGCTSLESIVIPDAVNSVGNNAFDGCTLLKDVIIPSGVGTIAPYMFYDCCGLENVTVSNGITEVGGSAFENCVGLSTATLPETVKTLGAGAFKNCIKLTDVIAPGVEEFGANTFDNCIKLERAPLSVKTKTISDGAFDNCVEITEIDLPANVVSVGEGAFNNCINLNKVTVRANANGTEKVSFGKDAFNNCFGLSDVHISDLGAWCAIAFADPEANPLYRAGKLNVNGVELTELVLPASVKEIGAYAFVNAGLKKASVHKELRSIGNGAFKGCIGLGDQGVSVESVDSWCAVEFGDPEANPLYYGERLYEGDNAITELKLSDSVKKIGAFAFYNCTPLIKVTIPASVSEVGESAFSGCAKLANITYALEEQPENWSEEWNDFCGTDVEGGTVFAYEKEKGYKPDTNTIMAMVVIGILAVVATVLLIMWLIKKIKKKIRGTQSPEAAPEEGKKVEEGSEQETTQAPEKEEEKE